MNFEKKLLKLLNLVKLAGSKAHVIVKVMIALKMSHFQCDITSWRTKNEKFWSYDKIFGQQLKFWTTMKNMEKN